MSTNIEEDISLITDSTDREPAIKNGWLRVILFLIASLIGITVFSIIGMMIMSIFGALDLKMFITETDEVMKNIDPSMLIILMLCQFGGMFLALWIFRKYIDRKTISSLGLQLSNFKTDFNYGLLLGSVLIVAGFFILNVAGFISITSTQFPLLNVASFFVLFIVVSLNEELMVRGYILNNLMASTNKYVALIVSSMLFMAAHLLNTDLSGLGIINLFIAGLVLGIYYIHKRNLWFSFGMHLTWNFFQGPIFGFEVSGYETLSIISQDIKGNEIITGGEFGFEGSILATILMVAILIFLHFKYKNKTANNS